MRFAWCLLAVNVWFRRVSVCFSNLTLNPISPLLGLYILRDFLDFCSNLLSAVKRLTIAVDNQSLLLKSEQWTCAHMQSFVEASDFVVFSFSFLFLRAFIQLSRVHLNWPPQPDWLMIYGMLAIHQDTAAVLVACSFVGAGNWRCTAVYDWARMCSSRQEVSNWRSIRDHL